MSNVVRPGDLDWRFQLREDGAFEDLLMPGGRAAGLLTMPRILAQSAIPFILPSSGSIGNNGALTGITALPTTYSGGCWMYFPANAIAAGVAAGWYWTVMSSTTAGTIYNSTYTSGTNFVGTATAFATTGPGAYTQTTSATADFVGPIITVPAGAMGPNGTLELICQTGQLSNANAKPFAVRANGTILQTTTSLASSSGAKMWFITQNKNNAASQSGPNGTGVVNAGTAPSYTTVNTAADATWSWSFALTTATDYIVLDRYEIRVNYGA